MEPFLLAKDASRLALACPRRRPVASREKLEHAKRLYSRSASHLLCAGSPQSEPAGHRHMVLTLPAAGAGRFPSTWTSATHGWDLPSPLTFATFPQGSSDSKRCSRDRPPPDESRIARAPRLRLLRAP